LILNRLRCATGDVGASAERRNDAGGRRGATPRTAAFAAESSSRNLLVVALRAAFRSCPCAKTLAAQAIQDQEIML
jgi:hypothetical protein